MSQLGRVVGHGSDEPVGGDLPDRIYQTEEEVEEDPASVPRRGNSELDEGVGSVKRWADNISVR